MTAVLEARGLSVAFGERPGLSDVSLTVNAGDCLAVLGTSGSGKSSLLRTLAGLQPASAGAVLVRGRDVTTTPAEQRSVVYLHQEPVLFPHLSVLENVAFPLRLRGTAANESVTRAAHWLRLLQVETVAHRRSDALSGGQRHRVALARALCAEPAVLLLDEPLASLDPAVRADVRSALLATRAASGAAMVLVTHDLDDALSIATHIAAVGGGTLGSKAVPADLLQSPPDLGTARLLGVYAEVPGLVSGDGAIARFRWAGGSMPAVGASVGPTVACVRAHEVSVVQAEADCADAVEVIGRTEQAHGVQLQVRRDGEDAVVLRAGHQVTSQVGERVLVTFTAARFFERH
jgi:putative spermidine/putrescine transport system ATP-binding protein